MTDHTSPHGKAVLLELGPLHRNLRHAIPEVYRGFGELSSAAFADGSLDRRTKELIALAIGVTFLMHGGPATIHGARAYEAFCEFAESVEAGDIPA